MPFDVIDSNSLERTFSLERSPEAVLLTNAGDLDALPSAIRQASDRAIPRSRITPNSLRGSTGGKASIVWLGGETLLEGAPEAVRRNLRHPGRACFVTTHLPGFESLDLLAVQPRFFGPGKQKEDAVDFTIHSACDRFAMEGASAILSEMREPWARLSLALYQEQARPGEGLILLDRLQRAENLSPILDAVVRRDLVVLNLRQGRLQEALKLLQETRSSYPGYFELDFIEAYLAARENDFQRALSVLDESSRKPKGAFVESGWNMSLRSAWLVGAMGDRAGNQAFSCNQYFAGVTARPSFEPSAVGFLKQRLPADLVDSMQWELTCLARRETRYIEPVFYFLLVHRALGAAQRMIETLRMSAAKRAILQAKFNLVASSYRRRPEGSAAPFGIILTGPFFVHSSLARINAELAGALLSRTDYSTALEPHGFSMILPANVPNGNAIQAGLYRRPPHLDLTIRHHWPHDFSRPAAGKLAVIVPWEFGAVPTSWVDQIEQNVDELWVPSKFVRDVFVKCGVNPRRIAVVPNGVNAGVFRPEGNAWRPDEVRGFAFLFVGGAIERKGVDVLVNAYRRAFTERDDVTLLIKDIGSRTFYRHMTLVPWLKEQAAKPESPRILVLKDDLDEARLADLYRACDAFVLPYRGEGFGMPLIEAMACGKPVIATGEGPAPEFCPPGCSYLISAKTVPVPNGIEGFGEFAAEPTWFEPDAEELARVMREVYENPAEAALRGARASERIRLAYDWRRITQMYLDRIAAIADRELSVATPVLGSAD
jgi:glycosyltransferase involved in cell wall biosynthesis